jgi:hypothetical protein
MRLGFSNSQQQNVLRAASGGGPAPPTGPLETPTTQQQA